VPSFRALLAAGLLAAALLAPAAATAAPFTVNSTGDAVDASIDGTCATSGAVCTLRAALDEANATAAADTITFAPSFDGSITDTIALGTSLPVENPVTIDGGDCDAGAASKPCAGVDAGDTDGGFAVSTPGAVTIRGLAITNTIIGVLDQTASSSGLVVRGNWIGRRLSGAAGSNDQGVTVDANTTGVTIGGPAAGDRNLFQNNETAVRLLGDANQVAGNDFGIEPGGTPGGANTTAIDLDTNGSNTIVPDANVIGGPDAGTPQVCDGLCNLIAGGTNAIKIHDFENDEVDNTTIAGNFLGIDPVGTRDYKQNGEAIANNSADGTLVGGPAAADRNYIGGSSSPSFTAADGAEGVVIRNNFLGVAASGTAAAPDAGGSVIASDPITIADNRFGAAPASDAAIGVLVRDGATITGNTFGVGTGGEALAGPLNTPWITVSGSDNTIGGDNAADENVLSNSGGMAILIDDPGAGADRNRILRNRGTGNAGPFIDLVPGSGPGNDPALGPNAGVQAPGINDTATTSVVSGTGARTGAVIRVFEVGDPGTVLGFAGSATDGDGGSWSVPLTGLDPGDCLAATQTDAQGNTSELSGIVVAGGGECTSSAPEEPQIVSGPQGGASTDDATPTWTFSTNKFATFECRVFAAGTTAPAFAPCSGPGASHTVATLADGAYTFEVRPTDNLDQVGPSHTTGFVVDAVPPEQGPPGSGPPQGTPPGGTPPGPGPTPAPAPDRTAPAITGLRLAARRVAVRLSLSEAASVRVVIERRLPGRRARFRRVAALTKAGKAGANRLALPAALARRLRAGGRFRVTVVATDAAGNRSARSRLNVR
jgi:hypothetical protein